MNIINPSQESAFQKDAKMLEEEMRENGYLSIDIVAVAYFLLKSNIDKSERIIGDEQSLHELLERAEKILEEE